jgi:DNA polymerase-3 subunit delta
MKYQDLISGLKKGKILPLYLFYGDEAFLIQEALNLIIDRAVDPGAKDFNFNTLYCRDTSASDLVNLCQTLPFMSERRLVIARDLDAYKAADIDELVPYLNDPSPNTCLVMVSSESRYDKKSVTAAVEAHGAVTRFFPLLDGEIVPWIEGWARARGLSVQRDAAQYLWQALGNDLQMIGNELEKVEIYIKGKKTITFQDMKEAVGDFREYSSFDLAAEIGLKNREKAFFVLTRLMQEGESPVGLLGSVAWNFRRLLQVKSMEASGASVDDGMKKLRPPVIFHQVKQFKLQIKSYRIEELRAAFDVIMSADRALKSSALPGRLVLERMILKLCGT